MLAIPEVSVEFTGLNRSRGFPVSPFSPVLTEVGRVTKLVGSECLVGESVLVVAVREGIVVVVRIRENHNVLGRTFAEEKTVLGLPRRSAKARRVSQNPLTPVPVPVLFPELADFGLFTRISKIPSGTFWSVPVHWKNEASAPTMVE